ncbi:glyoxalase [Sinomonas atrocyanea]|uniref:Glyoxalase n=1 Tax=Sinomonas atrocyanea TaxID=37927 RepID=A0A127A4E5_9MICC|nr:VOC family protein [Sinomonas atrocyanea]AMM34358.1 glyoxalase [Sinomonas atrocyanea]GEB64560.1 glyoxalase [Sinomonas atrocyanea]GGG68541.1 glyoxalase [Sinomonas atrocyanea]
MSEQTEETSTAPGSRAANGEHTVNGMPRGSTSLTPFIVVDGAEAAIGFYGAVFGARLLSRTDMPGADGRPLVAHAVLDFPSGRLELGDANPQYHLVLPPAGDDDCYSLAVYVPDVDAAVDRAVAGGATVREPATDFVSGDRFASIRDPFGIRWSIMTRVEDLSDDEVKARIEAWAASLGG